jgi:hypothetical protein
MRITCIEIIESSSNTREEGYYPVRFLPALGPVLNGLEAPMLRVAGSSSHDCTDNSPQTGSIGGKKIPHHFNRFTGQARRG